MKLKTLFEIIHIYSFNSNLKRLFKEEELMNVESMSRKTNIYTKERVRIHNISLLIPLVVIASKTNKSTAVHNLIESKTGTTGTFPRRGTFNSTIAKSP